MPQQMPSVLHFLDAAKTLSAIRSQEPQADVIRQPPEGSDLRGTPSKKDCYFLTWRHAIIPRYLSTGKDGATRPNADGCLLIYGVLFSDFLDSPRNEASEQEATGLKSARIIWNFFVY